MKNVILTEIKRLLILKLWHEPWSDQIRITSDDMCVSILTKSRRKILELYYGSEYTGEKYWGLILPSELNTIDVSVKWGYTSAKLPIQHDYHKSLKGIREALIALLTYILESTTSPEGQQRYSHLEASRIFLYRLERCTYNMDGDVG